MGIVPTVPFVRKCCLMIYAQVLVTTFLYSVSYLAHGGAIVAVLYSGPSVIQGKGVHKTVMHCKAIA